MHEGKIYKTEAFAGCPLTCQMIPMGKDYTIAVYGGELPHVGSVVMAQARPSLTGGGISATSSVINGMGHKDEAVARRFAETIAIHGNCTAVCACGIHVDDITPSQLGKIQVAGEQLLSQCLKEL